MLILWYRLGVETKRVTSVPDDAQDFLKRSCHLTATNKRHLVALLNHDDFVTGNTYKVNTIYYKVVALPDDSGMHLVTISKGPLVKGLDGTMRRAFSRAVVKFS